MFTKDVPGSSNSTEGGNPDGAPQGAGSEIEGSEMFSLRALMAQGAGAAPAPEAADRDDSGLIDLNALLGETGAPAAESVVSRHVAVSLFDIPAAPPADVPVIPPDPSTQRLARLWQTVAALCALGLVVAIAIVASGPVDQDQPAAAMEVVPPAVAPTQPALDALAAAPEPNAAPASPSLSEDPPAARAEPVKVTAPLKTKRRSTSIAQNTSETPGNKKEEKKQEKKAPTPAADPCNGDLRCAMERSLR
jgi:hypothetical protein